MTIFDGNEARVACNSIQPPLLFSNVKVELGMDQSWETDPASLSPNAQIRGSDEESTANETIVNRCKGSRSKFKRNRKGRTPLAELADEDAMLDVISKVAEITSMFKQELPREEYDRIIKSVLEERSRIRDVKNGEKITVKSVKKKIENTMSKKTMKRLQDRRKRARVSAFNDIQQKKLDRQEKLLKACQVIHKYRNKGKKMDVYLNYHRCPPNASLFSYTKNPREQKRIVCHDPLLSDQTTESLSHESSAEMMATVDSLEGSFAPNQYSIRPGFSEHKLKSFMVQGHPEYLPTPTFPESHDYLNGGTFVFQHPEQPEHRPFDLFRPEPDPDCSSIVDFSYWNHFSPVKDDSNYVDSLQASSILNYASVN